MNTPTPEQIAKLPQWAQDHIQSVTRLHERAQKELSNALDSQTPSPVFFDSWKTANVRRYFQLGSGRLTVSHADVALHILLATKNDGERLYGIELTYQATNQKAHSYFPIPIALMPRGVSQIQLVHKDNL